MRKAQPNPYFTGAVDQRAAPPTSGGWFLSSLLGIQRDVATSTSSVVSNISEEAEEAIDVTAGASVAASAGTNSSNSAAANFMSSKVLKAKPSELREMNFWSPTSM